MKELIIDKQTINLYPRLTTKKTSSGIVFIYNSNELLKISRKYTCLLGLEKEEDIPDYTKKYLESLCLQKEKFIELEKRSKNIKNTDFPLGIVKYNNIIIGTILKYIKNSCDIETFLINNPNEFYNIMVKLLDNIYELLNEYIYPTDIYYIETIDRRTYLYTASRVYESSENLLSLEKLLEAAGLISFLSMFWLECAVLF